MGESRGGLLVSDARRCERHLSIPVSNETHKAPWHHHCRMRRQYMIYWRSPAPPLPPAATRRCRSHFAAPGPGPCPPPLPTMSLSLISTCWLVRLAASRDARWRARRRSIWPTVGRGVRPSRRRSARRPFSSPRYLPPDDITMRHDSSSSVVEGSSSTLAVVVRARVYLYLSRTRVDHAVHAHTPIAQPSLARSS